MSDSETQRLKWDARHGENTRPLLPAKVLCDYGYLLPESGKALDFACGLGANALFLAGRGLAVSAWDLSTVAIDKLAQEADRQGLSLDARQRDLTAEPPEPDSFDVIVVAHFLDRSLAPAIAAALHPGGLLFYQTFTREVSVGRGPSNPDYRLGSNELLHLFDDLTIRVYREEGALVDSRDDLADLAVMVAQRPIPV